VDGCLLAIDRISTVESAISLEYNATVQHNTPLGHHYPDSVPTSYVEGRKVRNRIREEEYRSEVRNRQKRG
jgi:hypothetical protein